jgi:purine-nucleoside/S-methyl-5'-thioadenosine phosphorylase / adenosine deaminase
MHWMHQSGLRYLQFPSLAGIRGIFHGIFLRDRQDRHGAERSLNMGLACGESAPRVWQNRRRIGALFDDADMVFARQVHGTDVAVWPVDGNVPDDRGRHYTVHGDALVTDCAGQALFIQVADCQAALLVDPVRRAVANVHSGWRGSVGNILGRTVAEMVAHFDSRPEQMHCGIGPSLGPCCAEFVNYRDEIPQKYWPYRRDGDHFDFWRISVDQLVAAGVRRDHIEVSQICTRCNQHLFFSYRGERRTGRFAAVIGLSTP